MGEAYGRKVCDRGLNHHPCTVVDIIVGAPDSEAFTVLDEQATVGGVWDIEAATQEDRLVHYRQQRRRALPPLAGVYS